MPKPVCVSCQRFYRPEKNGYVLTEMMPKPHSLAALPVPPGTTAPEMWEPYKVWRGDLWKCQGCGHEIVVGFADLPTSEHYKPDFAQALAESQSVVNDC